MYKYARTTVGADNIRPYNDKLYFDTEFWIVSPFNNHRLSHLLD